MSPETQGREGNWPHEFRTPEGIQLMGKRELKSERKYLVVGRVGAGS